MFIIYYLIYIYNLFYYFTLAKRGGGRNRFLGNSGKISQPITKSQIRHMYK